MRQFFEQLPATSSFNDFANSEAYIQVPEDWYVALTDVIGSTKAIQEGRYKDVNAIGVASIAAVFQRSRRRSHSICIWGRWSDIAGAR